MKTPNPENYITTYSTTRDNKNRDTLPLVQYNIFILRNVRTFTEAAQEFTFPAIVPEFFDGERKTGPGRRIFPAVVNSACNWNLSPHNRLKIYSFMIFQHIKGSHPIE